MESYSLFAITSNSDTMEGRGHELVHGYTKTHDLAAEIVRDKRYSRFCSMGVQSVNDYKYMVREKHITVFSTVEDFFENLPDERRKRALAKLTPDEQKLLGLL